MFVWSFSSHWRIFHSYGDANITGKGLQILTYARHLRQLSKEGSLACHTHYVTGHPFLYSFSPRTRDSHTFSRAFGSGAVTPCFYGLYLSRLEFEHPTSRVRGQRSNPLRLRCGPKVLRGSLPVMVTSP